jgi:ATP-dependent exoDNAse (exonuclease V) alpha subunit
VLPIKNMHSYIEHRIWACQLEILGVYIPLSCFPGLFSRDKMRPMAPTRQPRAIYDYEGSLLKGRTLEIIVQDPKRLSEVTGIGTQKAAAIQRAWDDHIEIRNVLLFLQSHGVGVAQALKIFRQYGRQIAHHPQNRFKGH